MSEPDGADRYSLARLVEPRILPRVAAVGMVVAAVAASFAWVAGWLSPARLTPARLVDTLEAGGVHPGFRRAHAKGVCIAGTFESTGAAARLSAAAVFQPGRVPVLGRFALAAGQPDFADDAMTVRSMALSFRPEGAEEWRTAMNDIPVFVARDPASFRALIIASAPDPATGKPDPDRMKAFLTAHPETGRAFQLIAAAPPPAGFADASYNSLNAFRFIAADGTATPVRWAMKPLAPPEVEAPAADTTPDRNYLFAALAAELAKGPLRWKLIVTVGRPGDPTDDSTAAWPADREQVAAGTLTIDHIEAEAPGNCRDINFDPLALPAGIAPSDDPLLSARSAAYSESFRRRAGEEKSPSAVQVAGPGEAH